MIKDWLYSRFQTLRFEIQFHFSSVAQSCPSVCNPKDCSTPGLPVHHHLLEFTQIHVHWVGDAIQLSHPLSSLFPPAFNLSQHQGLFKWINSSHEVAKVLESASASVLPKNTQDWSPLGWTGWISSLSKGLSRVFSNTTVQKHQFFGTQFFFIVQLSHPYMTIGKTIALTRRTFVGKVMSLLRFCQIEIQWLFWKGIKKVTKGEITGKQRYFV